MFTFYEVGGAVRDELLGLKSKDIDYVAVPIEGRHGVITDMTIKGYFASLSYFLQQQGYEIFLETPACYTIRAKFPKDHKNAGIVADFVLARKEIGYKTGTREPIVVPGTLLDDLTRRDFTVNAIAKDKNGILYDPFNGQADLKERILNTPIQGSITFADDPLRLLRALRFHITKGFYIGAQVMDCMLYFDYEQNFKVVSEERIREELHKCFKHNTLLTIEALNNFYGMRKYIFKHTNLWLKPTNEL